MHYITKTIKITQVLLGYIKKLLMVNMVFPILLDYVFDELVTLIQVRIKRNDIATEIGNLVFDQLKDLMTLIQVSGDIFQSGLALFCNQSRSKYLSFTDCVIIRIAKILMLSLLHP